MNERRLLKELGLNANRLKIRDYYGAVIDSQDMPEHLEMANEFIDARDGDFLYVISLKHKINADRKTRKISRGISSKRRKR